MNARNFIEGERTRWQPVAESWVRSLLEDEVQVEPITKEDMPRVQEGIELAFGHYGDWVWSYTNEATDWSISFKAVVEGQMAGFYCLNLRNVTDEVARNKFTPLEDLTPYDAKTGLEGVALVVFPEFRGRGIGSALKDATRGLHADYIWGVQLKSLGNLEQWLRRRRLVAENPEMYLTLEDL